MRRLALAGLVLALVGVFLAAGFWPLFAVSGPQLDSRYSGGQYLGYTLGQQVLIHEKIANVSYTEVGTPTTVIQLYDGDANHPLNVVVSGDARPEAVPGTVIYTTAVLRQFSLFGFVSEYWEIPSPQDIQPAWPVDAAFYGTMPAGVVLVTAEAFRAKQPLVRA